MLFVRAVRRRRWCTRRTPGGRRRWRARRSWTRSRPRTRRSGSSWLRSGDACNATRAWRHLQRLPAWLLVAPATRPFKLAKSTTAASFLRGGATRKRQEEAELLSRRGCRPRRTTMVRRCAHTQLKAIAALPCSRRLAESGRPGRSGATKRRRALACRVAVALRSGGEAAAHRRLRCVVLQHMAWALPGALAVCACAWAGTALRPAPPRALQAWARAACSCGSRTTSSPPASSPRLGARALLCGGERLLPSRCRQRTHLLGPPGLGAQDRLPDQEDHHQRQAGQGADMGHGGAGAVPDHHERCVSRPTNRAAQPHHGVSAGSASPAAQRTCLCWPAQAAFHPLLPTARATQGGGGCHASCCGSTATAEQAGSRAGAAFSSSQCQRLLPWRVCVRSVLPGRYGHPARVRRDGRGLLQQHQGVDAQHRAARVRQREQGAGQAQAQAQAGPSGRRREPRPSLDGAASAGGRAAAAETAAAAATPRVGELAAGAAEGGRRPHAVWRLVRGVGGLGALAVHARAHPHVRVLRADLGGQQV